MATVKVSPVADFVDKIDAEAPDADKENIAQGTKRKVEGATTSAAKRAQVTAEASDIELRVVLASGKELAKLSVSSSATGAELMQSVQERLEPGVSLQGLLTVGAPVSKSQAVSEFSLESDGVLQAVLGGSPTLHLFEPCSALELAKRYGEWLEMIEVEVEGVFEDLKHRSIEEAPSEARATAEALAKTFGSSLKDYPVDGDGAFYRGAEVVVISSPGADTKLACLRALGIREEPENMEAIAEDFFPRDAKNFHDLAMVKPENWASHADRGICTREEKNVETPAPQEILDGTRMMAERLKEHFVFRFRADELNCLYEEPVLFGGFSGDGSIVGVLTGMHWD